MLRDRLSEAASQWCAREAISFDGVHTTQPQLHRRLEFKDDAQKRLQLRFSLADSKEVWMKD